MIIGISGRIGSGKDTVGEIIQKLCLTNKGPEFEIKKFAGKLKQTASLLTGIDIEKFEDQEFKKLNMSSDWDHELVGEDWVDLKPVLVPMTYREFLQRLGTEAMRDGLHTNVWINALFADYKIFNEPSMYPNGGGGKEPNWIITDMRFPNEMDAVVERKGITIRVVRSFNHKMGSKEIGTLDLTPQHPSETAIDDAEFDYEIINDGYIADLIDKVIDILTLEKLI